MSFNPPKSILIKECRKCSRQFYVGEKKITIKSDEEIEIILQTFRCEECKENNHHRRPK